MVPILWSPRRPGARFAGHREVVDATGRSKPGRVGTFQGNHPINPGERAHFSRKPPDQPRGEGALFKETTRSTQRRPGTFQGNHPINPAAIPGSSRKPPDQPGSDPGVFEETARSTLRALRPRSPPNACEARLTPAKSGCVHGDFCEEPFRRNHQIDQRVGCPGVLGLQRRPGWSRSLESRVPPRRQRLCPAQCR